MNRNLDQILLYSHIYHMIDMTPALQFLYEIFLQVLK